VAQLPLGQTPATLAVLALWS